MREFGNEVNTNNARNANNTKQSTLPKVRAALAGGISKFGNEKISKCGGLGSSEGNGEERKKAERNFDEKML